MIKDHKEFVAVFKKNMVTLSPSLQRILLGIHQYDIMILYKVEPQQVIADGLSRHNHSENQDEEILGMSLTVNSIETCTGIPK